MEPSETERGYRWLSNFEAVDQPAARLLLDGLELVGQDQLRSGIQQLIGQLSIQIPTPIALVPVRELVPGQSYFGANRNAKPPMLPSSSFPGSEAVIASILTSLRREAENEGPYVGTPSLRNMRQGRCRSIVLVDDFSGSGDRIATFLRGFRRHKTLRSWKSYGLIEYHVVTYSMTRSAHRRLCRVFGEGNVHIVRVCPTFDSQNWRPEERQKIEDLCRRYANPRLEVHPLGYKSSRGMMAFSHSAPNNLPVVLWQRTGGRGRSWHPFFQDRAVPQDIAALFVVTTDARRLATALRRLGQPRVAADLESAIPPELLRNVLLVLAATNRNPHDDVHVAELAALSLGETVLALATARNWRLISDVGLHLTDAGRAELRHAKGIALPTTASLLKGSDEPYYPRSLRVGR